MTSPAAMSAAAPTRISVFGDLALRHAWWWRSAIVYLILMTACALLSQLDDRTLDGVSVWTKPFKFSLSIAVYFATLAWFAPLLPDGYFETRKGRWLTGLPVVCAAFEIAYIIVQAARGEASHFNTTTPFHAAMYSLMGTGAMILVSICLWMGTAILRHRGMANPYALAVGIGLLLTFALGGGAGSYLGGQMGHWVGGTPSDAHGIWLLRWSRDGGDLRVAHFFGMHAMQLLPVLGWAAAQRLSRRRARVAIFAAAILYATGTILTFVQAVQGKPFV